MGIVELYIKLSPLEMSWAIELARNQPSSSSAPRGRSQQSFVANTTSQSDITTADLNQQERTYFEPLQTEDEEDNDDEDFNENLSCESDEDEEEDEYSAPNVNRLSQYNPFIGRGWAHPASSFHDSSYWILTDAAFVGKNVDFQGPLAESQCFASKEDMKNAIDKWHIVNNRQIKTIDCSITKYRVICKEDDNCSWMLYATRTGSGDAWAIQKCPYKHICRSTIARVDHAQLIAKLMADIIREDVENNLSLPIAQVRGLVRKVSPGVNPKYNKLGRAHEIDVAYLFGSWSGSYALLPQLLNAIKSSMPGTKAVVYSDSLPCAGVRQFNRVAWAYGPCIQAFPYMRPVISIDASFLKGRYKGRLLVVVGYDAENQLLPLAFVLVEKENIENWGWFMRWLRNEVVGNRKICVISDRHAAIKHICYSPVYGWNEESNESVHRLCTQHIAENLLKKCGNKFAVEAFKKACRYNSPWDLKAGLEQVEYWSKDVLAYVKGIGKSNEADEEEPEVPQYWSLCHDGGHRWDIITSNAAKSLNNVFKEARGLPLCAIVEATYYKLLDWFNERKQYARALSLRGQLFSERVTQILEKNATSVAPLEVKFTDLDRGVYEVIAKNERQTKNGRKDRSYKVVLVEGHRPKCKCREPQNIGIACKHVLVVCAMRNLDPNMYTSPYYRVDALSHTWEGEWAVFGKEEDWPEYNGDRIIPNWMLVKKGRRQSKRAKMTMNVMEERLGPQHCTTCGSIRHTSDRCTRSNMEAGTSQASTSRLRRSTTSLRG